MPNQIVLAWTVDVTNTSFSSAQAAGALEDVELYVDNISDPVLGQLFCLTVASDVTVAAGSTATRTLTLNMAGGVGSVFPCHPRTAAPPSLPYPLRKAVSLPGSFFVSLGSSSIPATETQLPSLVAGEKIQFLAQQGVFYEVASLSSTVISLTTPYTGPPGNTKAFKEVPAPVTLAAIYSTSTFDTDVVSAPPIAAGSGARTVSLSYTDSTGSGPHFAIVHLTGKRPAAVALAGGIDIAQINSMDIESTGNFENNVGQLTLCSLSSALPPLLSNATSDEFQTLTDEAQVLIEDGLAYIPPGYFALAQQRANQVAGIPDDAHLATLLGQFVATETAAPPLNPPLTPSTVPTPTFLSGLFTQTLQLALAVPVVPQPITFL